MPLDPSQHEILFRDTVWNQEKMDVLLNSDCDIPTLLEGLHVHTICREVMESSLRDEIATCSCPVRKQRLELELMQKLAEFQDRFHNIFLPQLYAALMSGDGNAAGMA